jgi:hypothetical protein
MLPRKYRYDAPSLQQSLLVARLLKLSLYKQAHHEYERSSTSPNTGPRKPWWYPMAYSRVAAEAGSAGYSVSSDEHSDVENELNGGCCLNGVLQRRHHSRGIMRSSASLLNIFHLEVEAWLGDITDM